jgi:hypothetical protein
MEDGMQHCPNWGPTSETARKYAAFVFALVCLSVVALVWTFLFL